MIVKIIFHKSLIFLAVLFIGLTACNKLEDINTDSNAVIDKSYIINNNFEDLNTRINIVREPISNINTLKTLDVGGDCFDYTWYLVAELESPTYEGVPLSATDVRILGDKAYVSYHRQGIEFAGAIEVIDISDPTSPTLLSSITFNDADINSLAIDDSGSNVERKIFLAGSTNAKGAILRQVIENNGLLSENVVEVNLSKVYDDEYISASANGIALSDDYIYMTSGNSIGGTYQLDKSDLSFIANEEYSDAKNVALNGRNAGDYQLSLVAGDDAMLKVYQVATDLFELHSWDLGVIRHQNVAEPYLGKATLSIREGEDIAFIAMNDRGMEGININTGATFYYTPSDMLTIGNTHGLAIDEKFIYLANSDDGLFIGCIPENGGEIIEVQRWDLAESGASANMVQTDGDWVFVAKGGGGLKILRKIPNGDYPVVCEYDENGSPLCAEEEVLCETLIEDFLLDLPERENAIDNHPEYFLNENYEIVLTESAEVSVTFVKEGAGYKNSFGYYTYDGENPPSSVADIRSSMKIIFTNASAAGSGGDLEEGDRVNLGTFDEGTVIGYFLIANGWNGTEVTEGLETFYTLPKFNREETQQAFLMYSGSDCASILTSFEDVHILGGDKDYNDVVIKTTVNSENAIDTGILIQL